MKEALTQVYSGQIVRQDQGFTKMNFQAYTLQSRHHKFSHRSVIFTVDKIHFLTAEK